MRFIWTIRIFVIVLLLAACRGNASPAPSPLFVQASADETNVTVRLAGSAQPLAPPASARLQVGDGVQVDDTGRALLRFSDFLTVEVLRTGDLQVQECMISAAPDQDWQNPTTWGVLTLEAR